MRVGRCRQGWRWAERPRVGRGLGADSPPVFVKGAGAEAELAPGREPTQRRFPPLLTYHPRFPT